MHVKYEYLRESLCTCASRFPPPASQRVLVVQRRLRCPPDPKIKQDIQYVDKEYDRILLAVNVKYRENNVPEDEPWKWHVRCAERDGHTVIVLGNFHEYPEESKAVEKGLSEVLKGLFQGQKVETLRLSGHE